MSKNVTSKQLNSFGWYSLSKDPKKNYLYEAAWLICRGRDSRHPATLQGSLATIWPESGRLSQNAKTCADISFALPTTCIFDGTRSRWGRLQPNLVFMARAGMSELSVYSRLLLLHNSPTVPFSKIFLPNIATILLIAWDSHNNQRKVWLNVSMCNQTSGDVASSWYLSWQLFW